ncbi:MAG: acetolactate synthase small subunit [Ruminococcaceae bacterium]|nr:acetolactate synthase small subunit [Oscillospiraceae bacterium]
MNGHMIAILVKNKYGVLNRITSMFRRRQFNISSLTVSETESAERSRITILFPGEEERKEQLVNQLYKLPDVISIKELAPELAVHREVLLIKVENAPKSRDDLKAAADAFGAKIVDYARDSVMYQMTGDSRSIDDFIELMRDHNILEICRTGIVALERGNTTITGGELNI